MNPMDPYSYQYYASYYQQQQVPPKPGVIGTEEAKKRLNAYAAQKSGSSGSAVPSEASPIKKSKNKELRKFFDEENPDKPPEKVKSKQTMMDKMAEIARVEVGAEEGEVGTEIV